MAGDLPISGTCARGLGAVRDAFVQNFTERGEVGAALCVIMDGQTVVDLVGGWVDAERSRPWTSDTLVDVYSTGKGVLATLALQLVESGDISLDEPVCTYWPEFADRGKERATVRHALSHQAGVPAIREPLTNDDLWNWHRMVGALASTEPWFEPGTRVVYHTNTYGHLVGELIRRASGDRASDALRRLADLLDADVWYALPQEEHHRCAEVLFETPPPPRLAASFARDSASHDETARMITLAYANPPGYGSAGVVNSAEWRSAEVPAANAHASATGVARIYSGVLEPGRILSSELLTEATRVQAAGRCPVLGEEIQYGLGYIPTSPRRPLGTNPHSFGHFGTGGSVGFADPDQRLAFGYVMNHVMPRWQSTRNRALIDTLYASLV